MSISNDLVKLLKQAGVDPNLYDTDRSGFKKDHQRPQKQLSTKDNSDNSKKEKKPMTLDVGPLEEYHDPQMRIKAIMSRDEDTGLKLIYQWTKSGSIDFEEFETLLAAIVRKIRPKLC